MAAAARVLVARTDSAGDVLLAGPAVRAVAATARVTMLVSPLGEAAARLLPGVEDVLVAAAPWAGFDPPPVDAAQVEDLVQRLRELRADAAVVLTSFHQSPLPVALLLRLAGIREITAASTDYPGSLLDRRLTPADPDDSRHEVERALDTVRAAGFSPAAGDDGALAVRLPAGWPPALDRSRLGERFVVLHPGASVPARAPIPAHAARIALAMVESGRQVLVTGGPSEACLTGLVATGSGAVDGGGRTSFAELATVLAAAECVVAPNTGPAHLAAAVGTPVVSLFAPTVPSGWWKPWRVPHILLGDQDAPCAGSRARACPVAGHPCLSSTAPSAVVAAVDALTRPGIGPAASARLGERV